MPGMDMSGHDMSNMKDMPMKDANDKEDPDASAHVMNSMEGHMDMGPHMKMTALRKAKPGDAVRAQEVSEQARKAAEQYSDYHKALADGFQIFHPEVPQKMYHFTNYAYAMEAAFHFNPDHPTSLLYEKHGDDYKLIGVMYTAPKRFTEDQLDERIPLSVAQWHEHVNFCAPPADKRKEMLSAHPQFGLRDPSRLKKLALLPMELSNRSSLTGWCTCIHSKKIKPASFQSNGSTATPSDISALVHATKHCCCVLAEAAYLQ